MIYYVKIPQKSENMDMQKYVIIDVKPQIVVFGPTWS